MKKVLYLSVLLLLCNLLYSQTAKEKWITLTGKTGNKILIDQKSVSQNKDGDIIVTAMEEFLTPFLLEGIPEEIQKTSTSYLINIKLLRYGITQIGLYNSKGKELKKYNYPADSEVTDYKYGWPLLKDSDQEMILNKCQEILKK